MPTAVDMQELANARARFPAPAMPPPGTVRLYQPGGLERLLHEAVGQRARVLAAPDPVKVPDVEASVALAIQPEQPLDLCQRNPTGRRRAAPPIEQPVVPVTLVPFAPAPQPARAHPQNLRRAKPMQLAAEGLQ